VSDGDTSSSRIVEKRPHSALKMIDINESCWNCGINKATQLVYGYPICDKCAKEGIDPEDMEEVVIESLSEKRSVALDEINTK
jgi:ribosomal protein L32